MEQLINNYFSKGLSDSEQEQFNQLMREDEEFRSEVEFLKEMRDGITLSKRDELKREMSSWDLESETIVAPKRNKKMFRLKNFAAAAGFLLLAASAFFLFENQNSGDYFSPMENISHTIQRSGESTEADKAFIAYEKSLFDEADALFGKLYEETGADYLLIYRANSKMANRDYNEALALFNSYLADGGELDAQALWYKALCLKELGEDLKALETLRTLEGLSNYKEEQVSKLIKRLS